MNIICIVKNENKRMTIGCICMRVCLCMYMCIYVYVYIYGVLLNTKKIPDNSRLEF